MKKLMMSVMLVGLVLFVGCDDKKVERAISETRAEMAAQMVELESDLKGKIAKLEEENVKLREENTTLKQRPATRTASASAQRQQQAPTQKQKQGTWKGFCVGGKYSVTGESCGDVSSTKPLATCTLCGRKFRHLAEDLGRCARSYTGEHVIDWGF